MKPRDVVDRLRAAGCVFAEDEAGLLLAAASGGALDGLVARRVAGEPLEVLLGWAEFAGRRIAVGPGVFVPRRRTEFLAGQALAVSAPGNVVVDLCCGAAPVAAALLGALPDLEIHGCDIDPVAVGWARRNLSGPNTHTYVGDLYAALPPDLAGRVDVVVANAPYVPAGAIETMPPEARDHEPRLALDGGADGVDVHRRVAAGAPRWLRPGGYLLIETSRGQAPLTLAAVENAGFIGRITRDDDVDGTVVIGRSRT